ncbi:1,5-anhydro-D-fructose reductase-like [Bacillus rossius redtenbacheri]|uniref:1,5-anhydro-D-fructose reductase-like n=1 Tax=Bacillus rossius redtenbacheri TaxID=93214 RepID=UPI002FDDA90A
MNNMSLLLSSGHCMPVVGLGTWQASAEVIETIVLEALQAGYRHIDTAFNYGNEAAIGAAVRRWISAGGRREDLFITTKLPHLANRCSDVARYLGISLQRLQLDYVDLYLVHMPFGFMPDPCGEEPLARPDGSYVLDLDTDIIAVWKAMEQQVDTGKARSIGVSNYNVCQLTRILDAARIPPATNQVELHAYLQQPELRQFCSQHGVVVTAFCPLGSPGTRDHFRRKYNYRHEAFPDILGRQEVSCIADKLGKTPAQVLLRHLIQLGVAIIPKSTNPERLRANLQVFDFELSDNEMSVLNALDHGEAGRIIHFRFWKGVEQHPEYPFPRPECP